MTFQICMDRNEINTIGYMLFLLFIQKKSPTKPRNNNSPSFILSNVSEIFGELSYLWCWVLSQVHVVSHQMF